MMLRGPPVSIGKTLEEDIMRSFGIALALGVALTLTAGAADAASKRSKASPAASQDSMADQLNAQSLQRAQTGQNSPTPGPDTTGNLNRMSDTDAMKGRNMSTAPMPFR